MEKLKSKIAELINDLCMQLRKIKQIFEAKIIIKHVEGNEILWVKAVELPFGGNIVLLCSIHELRQLTLPSTRHGPLARLFL